MIYNKKVILKDKRECIIRSGGEHDAEAVLRVFILAHGQTDFLLTYPDECTFTVEDEAKFLKAKAENEREVELIAVVDGQVAGTAGIDCVCNKQKTKHRAEFGISVDQEYWGLGIGSALLSSCVECAKKAGYVQLELSVVAANETAVSMYKKAGFKEFGRNPKGFLSRNGNYQEFINMILEL